jgi:glutaryl-CoA transferase
MRTVETPVRLSATPARPQRAAPGMGEHTSEVLRELGYEAREIDVLRGIGVVA